MKAIAGSTIVVFGATSTQGGGVVKALLQTEKFHIKAATRDASKPAATALRDAGAEIVQADLDNVASLDEALRGAYGLFLVTEASLNDAETEYQRGTNAITAAQKAGVQHFVFSALEDSRPYIQHDESYPVVCEFQGGASKLPFWDAKGAIKVTLQQSGVPYTCLYTEPFYENFQKRAMRYKRQPDDSIATLFPIPAAKIKNWQSSDAIGSAVAEILQNGSQFLGADLQVASHPLQLGKAVQVLSEVTNLHIQYQYIPAELFWKTVPGGLSMINLGKMGEIAAWEARRDNLKVVGKAPTFEVWAQQHKAELVEHIRACISA